MAAIFSAIVGVLGFSTKINEFVVTPLRNQLRYLFRYDDFIQELRVEVEELDNDTASLQPRIDAARRNSKVIRGNVETWISTAAEKKMEAQTILDAAPGVQHATCLSGTCPNLKSRYSSGKQAKKMTEVVRQFREKCGKFERVSDPAPRTGIETIHPTTAGATEFETRKRKEEEIMACLRDDTILMIGICGMGGVGKTTMADKIVKRASEEKLFDEFVKAVVNQQADLLNIQQQIARALGLQLEKEESVSVIANMLHKRLSAEKVLLYLDDVWKMLDLEKLGIPDCCKIILTSRDHNACIRMMTKKDSRKILSLDGLSEDESWVLFKEKTGSIVEEPDLSPLAEDVAKECKGLPLALVTVGSAMREKTNRAVWDDALLQLRRAAPTNIPGVIEDVYQPLKLSYDALSSNEARYFFRLCCLFREDSNILIEDLVYYGVALQIFSDTTNIREARNRAHSLVEMLKNRFLLMDVDGTFYGQPRVKMHDVIRDMALSIACNDKVGVNEVPLVKHAFMVRHDRGLERWPKNVCPCKDITCISLALGEEAFFPESINYPRLEALSLEVGGRFDATKLRESFFDGVTCLRFLSISDVVSSLSLGKLKDLCVLHLPSYKLGVIPFLGDLVSIEILSLCESSIEVLPKEIEALVNLKVLNLNYSKSLKNIAPGVVSSLSQLEELQLRRCPIEWEVEEKGSERSNASLTEVFSLRNLSLLKIWIGGLELIPQDPGYLSKLRSYHIEIGKNNGSIISETFHDEGKCMILEVDERNAGARAMSVLFTGVETLGLFGFGAQDIIDLLARQGSQNLKELEIMWSDTTKLLAATTSQPTGGIFPGLRRLSIRYMEVLEEICHGPPTVGSFSELRELDLYSLTSLTHLWKDPSGEICMSNLKRIRIYLCDNLKWVFPLSSVAKSLRQLEGIEIRDCQNLEEVFKDERVLEGGVATFHHIPMQKLRRMFLRHLPKLSTLCKAIDVFEFPSIEILEIKKSPNFKFSAHQQPFLSNKQHGIGIPIRLDTLRINGSFQGLRNLFSYDALRSLVNLRELEISDCPMLEEIVELEQNEEQRGNAIIDKTIVPRLETLKLSDLPMIRYFGTFNNGLELPSLRGLIIQNCPMMKTFAFESFDKSVPNFIPSVLFSKKHGISIQIRLHTLRINGSCQGLRTLFSYDTLRGLVNLLELEVSDCPMLEEIVELEKNEEQRDSVMIDKTIIPHLKTLKLSDLPMIHCFGTFNNGLELPSLEKLIIENCPMMKTFAFDSFDNSVPNSIPSVLFSKKVICPNLRELVFKGHNFTTPILCHEIPTASIIALRQLKVESCHCLKSLFSPKIFRELTNLEELEILDCSMLEEIVPEKEETIQVGAGLQETEVVWKLPKLKNLVLCKLPKIVRFSYLKNDLELPLLIRIEIRQCIELKSSLSLGLRCLPNGIKLFGISDPKLGSRLFFNKELTEDNGHLNHCRFKLFHSDFKFIPWLPREELFLVKGLSNEFFCDGWGKAYAKIEREKLTPKVTYEMVFVIMVTREHEFLKLMIVIAPDDHEEDKMYEHEECMRDKPTMEWIELLGGEFTPSSGQYRQLLFSVTKSHAWENGVLFKGVCIRPKEIAA